jgi:superfamily II DNA/RNA helicase
VCRDIAARGIDIPNTSLVVQMSLPRETDTYLHRAGRTGRLGREGKVVTLTQGEDKEKFVVKRFSNELGIEITKRALKIK